MKFRKTYTSGGQPLIIATGNLIELQHINGAECVSVIRTGQNDRWSHPMNPWVDTSDRQFIGWSPKEKKEFELFQIGFFKAHKDARECTKMNWIAQLEEEEDERRKDLLLRYIKDDEDEAHKFQTWIDELEEKHKQEVA